MSSELKDLNEFIATVDNMYSRNKLDELQLKRKESLANHDSLKYYYLCDLLGSAPEDKHLFKKGRDFFFILKQEEQQAIEEGRGNQAFLREASNLLSQNITHVPYYRGILIRYFHKFSDSGNQPVNKMDDAKVRKLFMNTYEYYKNKK